MQLDDNVIILMHQKPITRRIRSVFDSDPNYVHDLKVMLEKNRDFRSERVKTRYSFKWMQYSDYRERFFFDYIRLFHADIYRFSRLVDMGIKPAAVLFCSKYPGYEMTYGLNIVTRALRLSQAGDMSVRGQPLRRH